ncbi:MAG: RrF2 family transcriptional regulator [Nitrospinota bacterium]
MKISTKGQYAVIAMIDLARHSQTHPIPLPKIARRQNISQHYLEQLFVKMRRADLVKSTRGPGGGYVLAVPPSQITMKAVLSAVNEEIRPVDCGDENSSSPPNPAVSGSRKLWQKLEAAIDRTLTETTLEDLSAVQETGSGEVKIPDFQISI